MKNRENIWTVVLHFNRGKSQTMENLTQDEAMETIRIAVWNNKDCVNFSCYRVDEE